MLSWWLSLHDTRPSLSNLTHRGMTKEYCSCATVGFILIEPANWKRHRSIFRGCIRILSEELGGASKSSTLYFYIN